MASNITICPYCGCGCGFHLETQGKEVTGVVPNPDHPISQGSLCVKGWKVYEFVNHPDRLTTPLIKEKGIFRKAGWDEALDTVAGKLTQVKQENGGEAIGFFSSAKTFNEENYLFQKLARSVFQTHNVDHCARLCHSVSVAGLGATLGSGAMTNSIEEFERADLFLVTGSNTTEQHPLIGTRIIRNVVERGAKLILIDPRNIKLSKFATLHLKQNPGSDVAWLNGMMHVIINENLHAKDYINARVEGFETLKDTVAHYTPETVEKICGIPKDDLIKAARLYAQTPKAMLVYCMGITQHACGTDNVGSCANLAMLTGHIGVDCGGVNPLRGQNNVQGACDMGALPNVFPGYQTVIDKKSHGKFSKAWGVEGKGLGHTNGKTIPDMLDGALDGSLKALYIMGENPMVSDPDQNNVKAALKNLDFFVVQDIFLTPTAKMADVVLPAATFAEKEGTVTNTERRVQFSARAIPLVDGCREDWRIITEVANRCGACWSYDNAEEIFNELASLTPQYTAMSYDRLKEGWGLQWPCPDKEHPGTKFLHKGNMAKGMGTFRPATYIGPQEPTDDVYNMVLTTGRTYFHFHTRSMTGRTSTLDREVPHPYIEIHPEDAKTHKILPHSKVKVTSRRGSIEVEAFVSDRVGRGVVFIPFHFFEQAANALTNPANDPVGKIPEYKVCAVKLDRSLPNR